MDIQNCRLIPASAAARDIPDNIGKVSDTKEKMPGHHEVVKIRVTREGFVSQEL